MKLKIWLGAMLVWSCTNFSSERGEKIARVGDKYLYSTDLIGLIPPRTSSSDSANITSRFVDTWIKRELMLKAAKKLQLDEKELERRLEDYKYKLIAYEYEKQIIDQQLDTLVTQADIEAYYQANQENFVLKTDILRASMLKVAKVAPKLAMIRKMMREGSNKNELLAYALSNADFYHLNDSMWIDASELFGGTPFVQEFANRLQILRTNRYFETSDENFLYLLRVDEYKLSEQTSPIKYVSKQIKTIILNQRKNQLRAKLQHDIYSKAKEGVDFEIFNP
jgi:hypothetical protein